MNDKMILRFKDAPWLPKSTIAVTIGGAGGIGSWLALFLARAGFSVIIYDYDSIEEVNMAGQFFSKGLIGAKKVHAIQKLIGDFTGSDKFIAKNEKFTETSMTTKFMFSGFDNMEARKIMFERWFNHHREEEDALFIDGRLTAEQIQIFCVKPHQADEYKKYLFEDNEVDDTICSMKQTSHIASMCGSLMTSFFTNHFANIMLKSEDRVVPFSYELFSPIIYTEIKHTHASNKKTIKTETK